MKETKKGHKSYGEFAKSLIDTISKKMQAEIYESALDYDSIYKEFCFKSGNICITICRNGNVEVDVYHDNEHKSPTLEKAITSCLPEWGEIEEKVIRDRKEEQEFRDQLWRNCCYW